MIYNIKLRKKISFSVLRIDIRHSGAFFKNLCPKMLSPTHYILLANVHIQRSCCHASLSVISVVPINVYLYSWQVTELFVQHLEWYLENLLGYDLHILRT